MEIVGMMLMGVGGIISIVGAIWFLVVAFQESVLWGLGCLFIPIVSLVFLVMNWDKAAKPFLIQLGGTVVVIVGLFMSGPAG